MLSALKRHSSHMAKEGECLLIISVITEIMEITQLLFHLTIIPQNQT